MGTYVRDGNLTWQDEFDGVQLDAASQEEAGEGAMGLEYWWQHEEVRLPVHRPRQYMPLLHALSINISSMLCFVC